MLRKCGEHTQGDGAFAVPPRNRGASERTELGAIDRAASILVKGVEAFAKLVQLGLTQLRRTRTHARRERAAHGLWVRMSGRQDGQLPNCGRAELIP